MRASRLLWSVCLLLMAGLCLGAEAAPTLWDLRQSVGIELAEVPPSPAVVAPASPVAAAAAEMAVSVLPWLPPLKVRTILINLHLVGLCFGLGSVFVLDILLIKATFRRHFHLRNANMVWILSQTTTAGLALLWFSGIGFLLIYKHDHPELLENPKLVAKIAVVIALTLNGVLIHRFCLPRLMSELAPLLGSLSLPARAAMLFTGAVSSISWCFAAFLGTAKELNGTVDASVLLGMWASLVLAAFVTIFSTLLALRRI